MAGVVRIALAQLAPALGAFEHNVALHLDWISTAKASGAKLIVFPEASLTGYQVRDLASDLALKQHDTKLAPLVEASREIDVLAGFIERDDHDQIYLSAAYWSAGKLVHVHRKVYLPTYGIFDDGRFFAKGDSFTPFHSVLGTTGIAICEDLWHVATPYLYAQAGAGTLIAISSSPGRGVSEGGDLGTASSARMMNRFYAQQLSLNVVYVNRTGVEDGLVYWGGSEVVAPDGSVVARAPEFEDALVLADIDTDLGAREKARNPMFRDEQIDLVRRHLDRIANSRTEGDTCAS